MKGKIVGWPPRYYVWAVNEWVQVQAEEFKALFPDRPVADSNGSTFGGTWRRPIQSDALAVHPRQIPEVMERNRRHGLHIEYNPEDGRPILADRGQRRDLMRIEGCHDNDGCYGDDHA